MKTKPFPKSALICVTMLVVFFLNATCQTSNHDVNYGYGLSSYKDLPGFKTMRNWLILGPVKMDTKNGRPDVKSQKDFFDKDEFTSIKVSPNQSIPNVHLDGKEYPWKLYRNNNGIIDLNRYYGKTAYCYVYALAELVADTPANIVLGVGSDDAIKIFLNGRLIHQNWTLRPLAINEDAVTLPLNKGSNQLLVKVFNSEYDWSFTIRRLDYSQTIKDNTGYYSKNLPIDKYAGKNFRLETFARVEALNDSAFAGMFLTVGTKKGTGFSATTSNQPFRSKEWGKLTLEGKIDTGAVNLWMGYYYNYRALFCFDNSTLQVETKPGTWETVFKDDFEQMPDGYFSNNVIFEPSIRNTNPMEGKKCLHIDGRASPDYDRNNAAGKFAELNGIRLYYEVYGEGMPLLLLHGNGGSMNDFSSYIPLLSMNYKVIAIDSRAQGRSGDTEKELTYDQLAGDINALMEQLKIDSAYFWGHSDGAILALILAKDHPDKVKKVIAFGANIIADTTGIEPPIYRWIDSRIKNSKDPKEIKLMNLMYKYPNIPFEELSKIKADVLIVSGDRDFIPLEHTLKIFKHIPKSNLCIIPGSTHFASWEHPKLFMDLLNNFFEMPMNMPNTIDYFR